ncbi:MAG TPA: glycosyltransferase family 4 protein [Methylomirabilota bacterium]|nr:glycosyltransferase family 4 protein [Methylomirabilota bacterium]
MIKLTHLFTYYQSLGGVQSILRRHYRHDEQFGIDSRFCIFFEAAQDSRITGLSLTGANSIHGLRRRFASAHEPTEVAFYHNGWGVHMAADLDRCSRRIALLHSAYPNLEQELRHSHHLYDGIAAVSQPLLDCALAHLPEVEGRTTVLPLPISSAFPLCQLPILNRPIKIGFIGRIVREQKRVDRIPRFAAALAGTGIPATLEFLGEGPEMSWLKSALHGHNASFHGLRSGDDYWRILASWDFILFTSDYEGLPISLLEALSAGVLPLFPRINSGGDSYAARLFHGLLYETEAWEELVRTIGSLAKLPPDTLAGVRQKAQSLAREHAGGAYDRRFSEFIAETCEKPRISTGTFAPRSASILDHMPIGALTRTQSRRFFYCPPPAAEGSFSATTK